MLCLQALISLSLVALKLTLQRNITKTHANGFDDPLSHQERHTLQRYGAFRRASRTTTRQSCPGEIRARTALGAESCSEMALLGVGFERNCARNPSVFSGA
jgi:hypothetical protein